MRQFRIDGRALLAVMAGMVFGISGLAIGQYRPPTNFDEAFQADYLRRDLTAMAEELDLDKDQQAIVEALYLDYEWAVNAGKEAAREALAEAKPPRAKMQEEARAAQARMRTEMNRLREGLKRSIQETKDTKRRERLMEDYRRQVAVLQQQVRDARSATGPGSGAFLDALRKKNEIVRKWELDKRALSEEFELNTQSILGPGQDELWPALDRRLRREKTMPLGVLSGESTDLIMLTRAIDLPGNFVQDLDPTLDDYAIQLDDALKARNDYLFDARDAQWQAMQENNEAAGLAVVDGETQLRIRVRDVNSAFADVVAAMLPETAQAQFVGEYRERGFPRIYRSTRAERLFRSVLAREDLEEGILEAVASLHQAFLDELTMMNDHLHQTTLRVEPDQRRAEYQRSAARLHGGQTATKQNNPLQNAYRNRRAMEERYLKELEVLVPGTVPKPKPPASRAKPKGVKEKQADRMKEAKMKREEFLRKFDQNGDGKLDPDELRKAKRALQKDGGR